MLSVIEFIGLVLPSLIYTLWSSKCFGSLTGIIFSQKDRRWMDSGAGEIWKSSEKSFVKKLLQNFRKWKIFIILFSAENSLNSQISYALAFNFFLIFV